MRRYKTWLGAIAGLACAGPLHGQATGMPSFSAPYREFQQSEVEAVVSAPNGYGTAIEGAYGYALSTLDIDLQGGFYDPGGCCRTQLLVGAEARDRVITHTEAFPLDGALIVGLGAAYVNSGTTAYVPVGLSLGRRLPGSSTFDVEPYVQPTFFFVSGDGTALNFTLGLGADLRLSETFDARLSAGIGDLHGVTLGAAWLH
jgi:hypothetical protein